MGRSRSELNTGAGASAVPQQAAAPEAATKPVNIPFGEDAAPAGGFQKDAPTALFVGGRPTHPVTGAALSDNKWHSSWAGVSGYMSPKPINHQVQKVDGVNVIPKPKQAGYIPARARGERPNLPHRQVDYDGSQVQLTKEQKLQNKNAEISQANWDAHAEIEQEHHKASGALQKVATAAARQDKPKSKQMSQVQDSDEFIRLDTSDEAESLQSHRDSLSKIHALVAPLASTAGHLHRVSQTMGAKAATQSLRFVKQLNDTNDDGTPKIKEGSSRREILLDGLNESDNRSDTLGRFGKRHLTAMNSVATAKASLDGATKATAQFRTDDARRLLADTARHLGVVTKHLASPTTRGVHVEAGVPLHESLANGTAHSEVEDIKSKLQSGPNVGAISSGVKDPNPAPLEFNHRGYIKKYSVNKEGLEQARKHFGTMHPNYIAVKDAINANRSPRTSLTDASKAIVKEPALRVDERGVESPSVAKLRESTPVEATPEQLEAARARRPIPKRGSNFAADLQKHMPIAVAHAIAGQQIPHDTQRVLGENGLAALASHIKENHGKDIIR